MVRIASYVAFALAVTACVAETEIETASETQALTGCPKWGCGENSPVMGPYNFWELNVNGLGNNAQLRIVNFQIGNQSYRPHIVNGSQLVAVASNGQTVSGVSLTNGFFNVSTPSGMWKIIVAKVNPKATSNVMFWLGPQHSIETYELLYMGPGASGRLCSNPPRSRDSGEGGNRLWVAPLEAVLFTGDRYHADSMTVTATTPSATTGWFNIGCAGSVLAKLHLNRHTTAGSTLGWNTSQSQRQTLLKMYVSDVCGTGTAWTRAGTPLHWQNAMNWSKLNGLEFAFESQWGPNGAACMDTHRLGSLYTAQPDPGNPGATILDECVPPPCNGSVSAPAFSSTATIVSAVPFDPN